MLEKNLSKISIYKIPSPYIQPLPGIVGDSHSKSPLHILTTSFPRSNVLKRPSLLTFYTLFSLRRNVSPVSTSTAHFTTHPLPRFCARTYTQLHTHETAYLSGQWMSCHPFRLISRPWYFSRFHPLRHPSRLKQKRKAGEGVALSRAFPRNLERKGIDEIFVRGGRKLSPKL